MLLTNAAEKLLQKRTIILCFLVYVLFILLFVGGLYQKLYVAADWRIRCWAAPIAISTLYQGHKHDYRGWRSTAVPFESSSLLTDELLTQQIKAPVDKSQGHYYWIGDDHGFADYIIASFALFGPHVKSLYYFWFLILLLSITLFTISFGKKVWAMGFLALVMLGMHSSAAFLKLQYGEAPIFEPRFLDVLALIAVYHMMFTSMFFSKIDFIKNLWPLLGQLLIFTFLLHARSTLLWEVMAIIGISLGAIILKKEWKKISSHVLIIALLLCAIAGLTSYKQFVYHKDYLKSSNVRIFWHNALMGIIKSSSKPSGYLVDDLAVAELVFQHAKDSNTLPACLRQLSACDLLVSLTNYGSAKRSDWVAYENCAKKLYFSIFMQNKWQTIRTYLYDKPLRTIYHLLPFQFKSLHFDELYLGRKRIIDSRILPSNPFNLIYFLPFCIIFAFAAGSLFLFRRELFIITLIIFITSLILPVMFYECNINSGGLAATIPVLLYLGVAICGYRVYRWIKKFTEMKKKEAGNAAQ